MEEFFEYVDSFYGVGGHYNMGFAEVEIRAAVEIVRLSNRFGIEFCGDSIDREHVLVILEENFAAQEIAVNYGR